MTLMNCVTAGLSKPLIPDNILLRPVKIFFDNKSIKTKNLKM